MRKPVLLRFVHFGVRLPLVLEDWIPTYVSRIFSASIPGRMHGEATCQNPADLGLKRSCPVKAHKSKSSTLVGYRGAYQNSPFEEHGFVAWALTECKGTNCLGALVLVPKQNIVQASVSERLEEPLSIYHQKYTRWPGGELLQRGRAVLSTNMQGPGSPFSALKHRHVSSTKTGPPTQLAISIQRTTRRIALGQWLCIQKRQLGGIYPLRFHRCCLGSRPNLANVSSKAHCRPKWPGLRQACLDCQ